MVTKTQKFLTPSGTARILAGMKPLSEILKAWMDELELTPAEAARRCEISAQLYGQLLHAETLNPRASTLLKLARGTGLSMEILAASASVSPALVPA